MIQLYTGVPGSGKSCHMAKDMLSMLKKGIYVLANFDFDAAPYEDRFIRIDDYPLVGHVQDAITALPRTRREHNCVLVIDEAQRVFNSRDWNSAGRSGWLKFFTLSRHYGCDVVLIAQSANMVDKQIRACVQTEVRHLRVAAMGMIPFIISGFGLLPLCFWAESYFGTRIKVASGFFLPRKKFWSRYDSYDLSFAQ